MIIEGIWGRKNAANLHVTSASTMYAYINGTNWINPDDNAVGIVGFLQRTRNPSNGASGTRAGDESVDLHGRWSR